MGLIEFVPKYEVGEFVLCNHQSIETDDLMEVTSVEFKRSRGDWFKHLYYSGRRVPLKKDYDSGKLVPCYGVICEISNRREKNLRPLNFKEIDLLGLLEVDKMPVSPGLKKFLG